MIDIPSDYENEQMEMLQKSNIKLDKQLWVRNFVLIEGTTNKSVAHQTASWFYRPFLR